MSEKILVTGACGQIGTELVKALREKYGVGKVIATDIQARPGHEENIYYSLDVMNRDGLAHIAKKHKITQIYHLAAVLSANGEKDPLFSWELNMKGLLNVLEVARSLGIEKVFWPSSIAVFGPGSMPAVCFQTSKADPLTVYGISKLAGEYWCRYYNLHYGMDIRSIRYPGLISHSAPAGGGTTDYAVDIFHKALETGDYTCFLSANTQLPMMYMDDAIRATLQLMEATKDKLTVLDSYNLSAFSFTPAELAAEISRQGVPLKVVYAPDQRQIIADSWPKTINDHQARQDWGWNVRFDLPAMVADMLMNLKAKKEKTIEAIAS